uniref:EGF-like domain-containing protein n=1 Tax=Anopheles gambiae TaxID=7165 RepID=A0A1S4H2U6_ANOGA
MNRRATALCLTLLALGVTAGPTPDQPATGRDVEVLLTTASSGLSSEQPTELSLVETVSSFTQPTAEDSQTEVSSSSSSSSATSPELLLSSPASVDVPVDEASQSIASSLAPAKVAAASFPSPTPSEAPLMASSTIVSSGQTPTGEDSLSVSAASTMGPETIATTEVLTDAPKSLESITSTASAGTPESDCDDKKASDLEPESETPVISFGIRLFTVEVATGTERASEEQIDLSNATQAQGNMSSKNTATSNHDGVDPIDTTVSPAVVSSTVGSPESSPKLRSPESVEGSVTSTTTNGQSTVTINTQVMANGAVGSAFELPEDAQDDAFSNEIHVERNMKNGLYRIKIAEITTDEFDNGLRENDNENMLMTDTMGSQGSRQLPLHKSVYPSKINIDDFYPSKLEDFKPDQAQQHLNSDEEQRLREKDILRNEDGERLFESTIMKPSDILPVLTTTEVDEKAEQLQEQLLGDGMERPSNVGTVTSASSSSSVSSSSSSSSSISPINNATGQDSGDISTTKIEIELIDDTSETSASDERSSKPTIDNITEKLEENDEVISRIEENFKGFRAFEGTAGGDDEEEYRDAVEGRKDDEVITIAISSVTFSSSQQDSTQTAPPPSASVSTVAAAEQQPTDEEDGVPVSGSDIVKNSYGNLFIPRRVKKNDPSTATKLAQLGKTAPLKKIDFAATKFNTDNNAPGGLSDSADGSKKDKPEFSTTKFYNSKELYSELHHQALVPNRTQTVAKSKATAAILSEKDIITAKTMSKPAQAILAASSRKSSRAQATSSTGADNAGAKADLKQHTLKTNFVLNEPTVPVGTKSTKPGSASASEDLQQRKIKSLGSAASAIIAATAKLAKPSRPSSTTTTTTAAAAAATTTTFNSMTTTVASSAVFPSQPGSNDSNRLGVTTVGSSRIDETVQSIGVASKPSVPLSRLHEKINTLDCEIQSIAPDSSVWRGNETHELQLPAMTPEDCSAGSSCTPTTISWEGTADIQSGDVLIVEIDDHHLIPSNYNKSSEGAHHTTTAVYQVTRLGHENCDITEGVLLDITPLVADGKKLVTLYDKDLTEGINLLIVVSEQWGQQCVRLKVTVKSDNCGENADCSGKGVCYSNNSMEGYECQCCSGFAGTHCEEIDACSPSPCTNNGICVDLSQGHEGSAYQCLCPYGYTGKNCQFESDPCNPSQCLNGGTCVGNSTHFRCDCTSGYTGPLCQHNLNECESSPCVHGICVDQEDGFRCFCQPGFSGELCNFEYNECESNPCINGGQCIDNIGGFSCKCTRGYTGKRCHIKVDFCANDPCPDGHRCIDHGDDFTCECPGGRNGPDCNQVPRTLCNVNPCANGGTCWTTEESFYCACRPGFTGKMCEENFVIDTMVSSSEMLSDTLANQNGLRAISGSTMYGDDGAVAHTGKHSSAIELHNAYIAAGTLATAILIVAVVVTACHCKVHQSYRHFATKHRQLIPIFGRRAKPANANRHWLSGKGHQQQPHHHQSHTNPNYNYAHQLPSSYSGLQPERIINKPLPMNLENDMYYTVDFGDSQNAPLIQ